MSFSVKKLASLCLTIYDKLINTSMNITSKLKNVNISLIKQKKVTYSKSPPCVDYQSPFHLGIQSCLYELNLSS